MKGLSSLTAGLQVHDDTCTDVKTTEQVSPASGIEDADQVSEVVEISGQELEVMGLGTDSTGNEDEVVHHKIDKVVLKNFQSWVEATGAMEFKRDIVNRIHARNETGKSVMFKVFKQMCFPGKGGNQARKDLIKRNCTRADAEIYLSDGNIVKFTLTRPDLDKDTTFQYYELIEPDGKKTRYEDRYLPDPVRRVLGWYVDPAQRILLNLIEKDGPQLFINTTPSFNAEALKFITENPRVTEAVKIINEWVKECKTSREKLQRLRDFLEGRLAGMEYIDIASLELQNERINEILPPWSKADTAELKLEACMTVFSSKPKKPDIDFERATELIRIAEPAIRVDKATEKCDAILRTKPAEFKCDMELASQCSQLLDVIGRVARDVEVASDVHAQRPRCINIGDPKRCAELVGIVSRVDEVLIDLDKVDELHKKKPAFQYTAEQLRSAQEVVKCVRALKLIAAGFKKCVALKQGSPKCPVSQEQLEWLKDAAIVSEKVDRCYQASAECYKVLRGKHKAARAVIEVSKRLEAITQQLPECPICGSPMNGGRAG